MGVAAWLFYCLPPPQTENPGATAFKPKTPTKLLLTCHKAILAARLALEVLQIQRSRAASSAPIGTILERLYNTSSARGVVVNSLWASPF